MDSSSLNFMTCDELREEIRKCPDDINKRILIIDVRKPSLYARSHLHLDTRNNIKSINTKMRVMNIDPDLLRTCTVTQLKSLLNESDAGIFDKRKDATEVVIIDEHTDDLKALTSPKSKVSRIINSLTKFDYSDDKITVPIHILKGGFKHWRMLYQHFTTDPSYDPESENFDTIPRIHTIIREPPSNINTKKQVTTVARSDTRTINPSMAGDLDSFMHQSPSVLTRNFTSHEPTNSLSSVKSSITLPNNHTSATPPQVTNSVRTKNIPSKPVMIPPARPPTNVIKNAPGTAIPVTPIQSLRPALPRSHSSPNVAQPEEEDLEFLYNHVRDGLILDSSEPDSSNFRRESNATIQFQELNASALDKGSEYLHTNRGSLTLSTKPRFDRTLKPAFNNEFISAIRARLNFGRSPEASGKAITGLQNLGNTCFMNSVIQCLAYVPYLATYFCSQSYFSHINFHSEYGSKGELAIELGSLIEKLNAHKHRYIEPKSFRESITKHIGFAGNDQQDSHEFLMMLFEKLHHDLNLNAKDKSPNHNGVTQNGKKVDNDNNINIPRTMLGYQFWKAHLEANKSIISDLFEGIFMSTLTCAHCQGQSNTFEVFNCLSLPIASETRCHLRDCLNHFSNPERIEGAWECPRCKQKRDADKKIVICKLPKVLIIHFKRFSLDGRWRHKLQTVIDFPLGDLTVDCTNVLPQSAYGPMASKNSYKLISVINHYGHLDGGHYTAFCKLDNMRWYTFDDSNVSEMKDSDVCGQAAYLLFYASSH